MTLTYLKKLNPQLYGHLPDVDGEIEGPKRGSNATEEERIMESLIYGRETSTLGGNVGSKAVSVGTQCEIKVAAKHVRELQKMNIEQRIEIEALNIEQQKLVKRIENLIKEKNEILTAFQKIEKQSFSAYQALNKDR